MASVKKEDARIEKVIRGLLKLPGNRRCMNCNLLGPQYVCTTFSTFVCTSCSGIHREFTHRVKSVSMAKFTSAEVDALQAGGNEKAKQIYFKEWDPQRHSYPDSNNIHKLREFIKRLYVDRKYTGEKSSEDLPRIRLTEKEQSFQSGKSSSFHFESKSSDHEDRFERHYSERSSPSLRNDDKSLRYYYDERRSPRYAEKYSRQASVGRKPAKFEVVDDRFKDDEFRNRRLMNLESKLKQLQPGSQKNVEESQSPAARPSKEVLEVTAPSPKVGQPSQAQNKEAHHDLPQNKAPYAAVKPEMQAISQSSEDNWATFDSYTVENVAETSNSNTLTSSVTEITPKATFANSVDLLLFELSGPLTSTTGGMSEFSTSVSDPTTATVESARDFQQLPSTPIGQTTASPKNSNVLSITPTHAYEMEQPSNAVPSHVELYDREDSNEVSHGQELSSMQFPPPVSVGSSSTAQPTSTPVTPIASNDMSSDVLNSRESPNAFTELSPQTTSKPVQDTEPDVGSQPCAVETKSSGRKELPEDLFTSSYLSGPESLASWHNVQPHGMGYGLHYYPNAMPPSAFPITPKSSNPFEETAGKTLSHTSSLPTLSTLHSALPGVSPRTGLTHASSYGSVGMAPNPTSYGSPVHPQSAMASGFPSGSYFGQVNNHMQPPRPERVASFNNDRSVFGSLGTMQPSGGEYMAPNTPNSFPKIGGNPFGDD